MASQSEEQKSLLELGDYMQSHGINGIIKDCITQLCMNRPDNPVQFMRKYFESLENEQIAARALENARVDEVSPSDLPDSDPEDYDDFSHVLELETPAPSNRRRGIFVAPVSEEDLASFANRVYAKNRTTLAILAKAVEHNVLFEHLDENERNDIFDAMTPANFPVGASIITQGVENKNFFIVENGQVEVFRNDEIEKIVSCGGSFGELALIYDSPCSNTAIAKSYVRLWTIDRDTYRQILIGSANHKRGLYQGYIARIALFDTTNEDERENLIEALQAITFEEGTTVVSQGEPGDSLYIIIEGFALVLKPNGNEPVARFGPGDHFGELSLLSDHPRGATVVAHCYLKCVKIDKARFERVVGPCDKILKRNISKYKHFLSLAI